MKTSIKYTLVSELDSSIGGVMFDTREDAERCRVLVIEGTDGVAHEQAKRNRVAKVEIKEV